MICNATGKRNRSLYPLLMPDAMKASKVKLIGRDFVSYGHYRLTVENATGETVDAVTGDTDLITRLSSEDQKEREEAESEAVDFEAYILPFVFSIYRKGNGGQCSDVFRV